ncbi:MAG TPA: transcription termination factor Rho, partial [Candidatus Acetothermia bacterium]|nr:transcription termination factor Rho [Candidatus Acetothermia bacterium]
MELSELRALKIDKLQELAKTLKLRNGMQLGKEDLQRTIMVQLAKTGNLKFDGGVLEILPDGYGFLRGSDCLPARNDTYVSPSQIKRFGLRDGDTISGVIRAPKNDERYFALIKVEAVNGAPPEESRRRPNFRELTPLHPNELLELEHDPMDVSTRIIDLFSPIGKG